MAVLSSSLLWSSFQKERSVENAVYCNFVGLFSEMCLLAAQLVLSLNSQESGVYHNTESDCVALCYIAKYHADQVREFNVGGCSSFSCFGVFWYVLLHIQVVL